MSSRSILVPVMCLGEPAAAVQPDRKKTDYTLAELSGTLGGFGSRDREKSRLEERRKKWIADLNEQVEKKKQVSCMA